METTLTFLYLGNYTEGTSAKGAWKKQEAIFETRDQYPHKVCVIGWGAMVETLQACKAGMAYDLKIDAESREWLDKKTNTVKWFTDIKCFGIVAHPTEQPKPQQATQTSIDTVPTPDPEKDDLPF